MTDLVQFCRLQWVSKNTLCLVSKVQKKIAPGNMPHYDRITFIPCHP